MTSASAVLHCRKGVDLLDQMKHLDQPALEENVMEVYLLLECSRMLAAVEVLTSNRLRLLLLLHLLQQNNCSGQNNPFHFF